MAKISELVVGITGDNSGLTKSLDDSVGKTETAFSKIGASLAAAGAAAAVFGGILKGIDFNKAAEQAQTSFAVMLGSAQKAQAVLKELKEYANSTPLEFPDIRDAAQTLIQFGLSGDDAIEMIKQLGDVSGGNADKLKSLALAFGQMSSTGRLMGQDLNQMINAGFNPLLVIAKDMAKEFGGLADDYMPKLKKQMEEGAISTDMVRKAFEEATSEGGQFYGMLEKQSQTFAGVQSTMSDAIGTFLGALTQSLMEPLKALMSLATDILGWLSKLPGPVLAATATFVSLGAAIAAITAAAPMFGIALSSAFGPIGLAIAGAVAGFVMLYSFITDASKKQKEFEEIMKGTSEMTKKDQLDALAIEQRASAEKVANMRTQIKYSAMQTDEVERLNAAIMDQLAYQGQISKRQQQINAEVKEEKAAQEAASGSIQAKAAMSAEAAAKARKLADEMAIAAADEGAARLVLGKSIEDALLEHQKKVAAEKLANEKQLTADKVAIWTDEYMQRLEGAQASEEEQKLIDEQAKQRKIDDSNSITSAFTSMYQNLSTQANNYKATIDAISAAVGGALASGFKALGEAISTQALSWKSFAKIGLQALSSILDAIGAQLAAIAVVKLVSADFVGAALAGAGSAASYIASGLATAEAGKYATGTDFAPGGMAIVGEQGPEMVNLPRGAQVKTASETAESGGAGNTFHIYSPKATPDEMMMELRQSMRQLSFEGAL